MRIFFAHRRTCACRRSAPDVTPVAQVVHAADRVFFCWPAAALHASADCGGLQVSIPELEAGLPAYYILAMSEASSNLSRYDGIRYGLRNEVSCTMRHFQSFPMHLHCNSMKAKCAGKACLWGCCL